MSDPSDEQIVAEIRERRSSDAEVMSRDIEIEIDYTNYRGERGLRRIKYPKIVFKHSSYHPEYCYRVEALDIAKNALREFPLKDIHSWREIKVA
jgi:hypothetical protein